ncbi:MAG: DUF1929 domain-containing protein [Acidobacteria bacterium]|nr:DUF1929 domain-containing protein [Acidobacteriota bacterium]
MFYRYVPTLLIFLLVFAVLLNTATPVSAHDIPKTRNGQSKESDVSEHWRTDFGFPGFDELNVDLQRHYKKFDNRENLALSGLAYQKLMVTDGHLTGSWSPPFSLPLVPIHVMLQINGTVLMWDSVGDNPAEDYPTPQHNWTRASIWDPSSNLVSNMDNTTTGYNMFCAGHAHLPDGRAFLAGGNLNEDLHGTKTTHIFDPVTNVWTLGPMMTYARWYPSVTPLANGEMLITAGSSTNGGASKHEVYTTEGTIRQLSSLTYNLPIYPWVQAAPNGKALVLGTNASMYYINTEGTGSRQSAGSRDSLSRTYGSYAMYDIGKVVASGGASSSKTAVVIDFTNPNANPVATPTSNMHFGRRQHNLTALPDGTVLATGGNSSGTNLINMNTNVYDAELWDPATGQWTVLKRAEKRRQYHSTALLLPDGRVFTGGGGICGDCHNLGYLEKNFEIFTPPYLYDSDGSGAMAARPAITYAPDAVAYAEEFMVETPIPNNISQAVLMRMSSVTHSVDFEQRRVPMTFTRTASGINANAPANANIAPPGFYMLFLIDNAGVPSIAKIMQIAEGEQPGAPMIIASSGGEGTAELEWIPVPGATGYIVKYGTSPGVYTGSVNVTGTQTSISGLTHWRYYFSIVATGPDWTGTDSEEVGILTNVGPTSAGLTVSGRVLTAAGYGIPNVRLTIIGANGEVQRTVMTNGFGYYQFHDVPAGQDYSISASARSHRFVEPTRFIRGDDNLTDVDFVSVQ